MRRFRGHIQRFHQLREQILSGAIEEGWLQTIESQDSLFPRLDYRVFCGPKKFRAEVELLESQRTRHS